jgi:uncharacterized Fe-S cluster-containing MiaB family protein
MTIRDALEKFYAELQQGRYSTPMLYLIVRVLAPTSKIHLNHIKIHRDSMAKTVYLQFLSSKPFASHSQKTLRTKFMVTTLDITEDGRVLGMDFIRLPR